MLRKYKLEVCSNSIQSAINAENGGADRIELCDNLLEGGTTPSYACLDIAKSILSIPINVLIRPRGGDFLYNPIEKEIILRDIEYCRDLNLNGVVIGCLNKEGEIDIDFLDHMLEIAGPMSITFHRAIDMAKDMIESVEILKRRGINRILTSGGAANAIEGKETIRRMVEAASGKISIMAGGGINSDNIASLIEYTNITECHVSGKHQKQSSMEYKKTDVNMNGQVDYDEYSIMETSEKAIQNIIGILNNM
ncbi:MAG: copper homeostasis protein CutC [Hyphomicrobiales bacterium]